jgi:hypothetical protein
MRRLENALRQTSLAQRLEQATLNPALVDSLTRSRLELESESLIEKGRGSDASRQANLMFAVAVAFLLYMSMILYGARDARRAGGEVHARGRGRRVQRVAARRCSRARSLASVPSA